MDRGVEDQYEARVARGVVRGRAAVPRAGLRPAVRLGARLAPAVLGGCHRRPRAVRGDGRPRAPSRGAGGRGPTHGPGPHS